MFKLKVNRLVLEYQFSLKEEKKASTAITTTKKTKIAPTLRCIMGPEMGGCIYVHNLI